MTCKHNWVDFKDNSSKPRLYAFQCTRCRQVCFSELITGENHGS